MRIKEVIGKDKLDEILMIPDQVSTGFDDLSAFDNVKQFRTAKVEKYPLLYLEDVNSYSFCIKDIDKDNRLIGFIVARKNTFEGRDALEIRRTWVESEYRNRGFMTAMYNTLHNQGFVLISDMNLSPNSIKIWKTLSKLGLKILDINTNEIRDATSRDFKIENKNTRFLLEGVSLKTEFAKKSFEGRRDNSFLMEYQQYIGMEGLE